MKNILVVDDEETILVTLVEWFAYSYPAANYNVMVANNGIEAIKILTTFKIDLLITDLNMPKMDGFELLVHMNNDYPATPIIVMSAFATPDIKNKVKNMGVMLFIPKPFATKDLEEIEFDRILGESGQKDSGKGYVNGISLQSFLQLINIESKTCTLTVKYRDKIGIIYVDKGDLMNAKTGEIEGSKAAQEIISWNNIGLTIEIENKCPVTEKKINHTIMSLLMEAARMADELAAHKKEQSDADKKEVEPPPVSPPPEQTSPTPSPVATEPEPDPEPPPVPPQPTPTQEQKQTPQAKSTTKSSIVDLHKLDLVSIQSMLKDFAALDGFSGAVLSTSTGEILQIVRTEGSQINLEQAAIYANSILATSHNSTTKMKMEGEIEMVQVETKAGYMLISGQSGINIMLILANTSSLGLGKIMASRTLEEIVKDLRK